jgi:DNA-binding beta-propeller fold protein YncE
MMVDPDGFVWFSHRAELTTDSMLALAKEQPAVRAPLVMRVDQEGKIVQSWGPLEEAADWPAVLHGLFMDHTGHVWSTARDRHQIIKFTQDGERVLTIGKLDETGGSDDPERLGRPADIEVDSATNELFVVDGYTNRRVIVFDAETGAYKRHWGAYGEPPDDAYQRDSLSTAPSRQFDLVHGIAISRDGLVYVADQTNSRIQVFQKSGEFVSERVIRPGDGAATAVALSPDPEQRFLYVADGTEHRIWILRRVGLEVVGQFGGPGTAPGQFGRPHSLDVDAEGNLYVAEAAPGMRVQKFGRER